MFQLDSGSYVFFEVEVHYGLLTSDVALVFSLYGSCVHFCIVLVVSNRLFMPVNCLYCADVILSEL